MQRRAASTWIATVTLVVTGCSTFVEDVDVAPPATPTSTTSALTTTTSSTTSTTTTISTTTTSSSTTITTTTPPSTTVVEPEAPAGLDGAVLRAALHTLTVEAEPPRVGYDRALFPHWHDTNGSGCTARQDALLTQVVGFPQVDLFDRCVVVEGDWYSPYDGLTHSGQPGDVDIDHVVALSESWDSGASVWPIELRRQFANDPINLVVSSRSANSSKGDRDAGGWKPPQRDIWCFTAATMISTKVRYELTIDAPERDGLDEMISTCDEPDQRTVPGVPLPGTDGHALLPPVVIPAPARATIPPAPIPPADESGACRPGQVNINTASETDLLRIIHIGHARAAELVSLRPFPSVRALTRISGIAEGRLNDILNEGIACA